MSKFLSKKLLFLFIVFSTLTAFFSTPVQAGDGSVTSVNFQSSFSDSTCEGFSANRVLYDVQPRPGSGEKTFTFVATPGNSGTCQIYVGGSGRVCGGSTTNTATLNSGDTYNNSFTTCTDGGLSTSWGVTYTIFINAAPSIAPSPTTLPSPPQDPQPFYLQLPQSSCGNIRLSWSPYSGASYYKVYFIDQENGVFVDNNIQTGETHKDITTTEGLIPGRNYAFLIGAFNLSGQLIAYSDNGTWSYSKFGTFTNFPDCRIPGRFTQSRPVDSCRGTTPQIALSWQPAPGTRPMNYYVTYFDSNTGTITTTPSLGDTTSVIADSSWGLIPGNKYSFIILASNSNGSAYSDDSTWSNTKWNSYTLFPNCNPPDAILQINNKPNTIEEMTIYQNAPAVLGWQAINADICNASSNPRQAFWNGPIALTGYFSSGSNVLNTAVPGTYRFSLNCTNSYTGLTDAKSIQLIINKNPNPYIQTTGGDIHSNESINITP